MPNGFRNNKEDVKHWIQTFYLRPISKQLLLVKQYSDKIVGIRNFKCLRKLKHVVDINQFGHFWRREPIREAFSINQLGTLDSGEDTYFPNLERLFTLDLSLIVACETNLQFDFFILLYALQLSLYRWDEKTWMMMMMQKLGTDQTKYNAKPLRSLRHS